jgi:hypothetical protein
VGRINRVAIEISIVHPEVGIRMIACERGGEARPEVGVNDRSTGVDGRFVIHNRAVLISQLIFSMEYTVTGTNYSAVLRCLP